MVYLKLTDWLPRVNQYNNTPTPAVSALNHYQVKLFTSVSNQRSSLYICKIHSLILIQHRALGINLIIYHNNKITHTLQLLTFPKCPRPKTAMNLKSEMPFRCEATLGGGM